VPTGRVLIAPGNPLAASPSWARYDELAQCRCAGWEVDTGRSSVFEVTDVGTATVHFEDRNRTLDTDSLMGRAILLQIRDPVTAVWEPSYRGVIDQATFDVYPMTAGLVSTVQLRCVDMFAYLARVELVPGVHGDEPTHGNEGSVVYGEEHVDDRIKHLFLDAEVPDPLFVAFTGHSTCWDSKYDPGESVLTALREAADAEFPGIGNILCDRRGRICFHGRQSRFTPEAVVPGGDWTFTRWGVGDADRIAAHSDTAQLRELTYSRDATLIYNAAQAWPAFIPGSKPGWKRVFPEGDKTTQAIINTASRTDYGLRAMPPMADLIVKETYAGPSYSGPALCQLFAAYYVANYGTPHRIPITTIKSIHPSDPRAAATWAILTRIEISDVINLHVGAAGMSGDPDDAYFVEGWHKTVAPLDPNFDYVELTPNLSSVARYATDPFTP
jgi:hypothetical protein